MNTNLNKYSGINSMHGREYMISLLDRIECQSDDLTTELINELLLFDKAYDKALIREILSDYRFSEYNTSHALVEGRYDEINLLIKEIDNDLVSSLLEKYLKNIKKSAKDKDGSVNNSEVEIMKSQLLEELFCYKYKEPFRLLRSSLSEAKTKEIINGYNEKPTGEKVEEILSYIDQKYYDVELIKNALSEDKKDYGLIRDIITSDDDHLDNSLQILRSIYEKQSDYPTSKDFIKRVVLACKDDEFDSDDSIRLLIVKQFLKNGYTDKYLINIDYMDLTDDMLDSVKETIKESCNGNKSKYKDAIKEYNKTSVVALAEDLSKGIIKSNNATREKLLKFAVAFNMRCSYTKEEADRYGVRDINQSLFGDYYSFLAIKEALDRSADHGKIQQDDKAVDYGSVASAVNFKNPIDCIYAFYMNNDEIPVYKKWNRIKKMISYINVGSRKEVDINNTRDTVSFKEEIMHIGNDEGLFEDFIRRFDIYTFLGKGYNINYQIISGRQCYEQIYDEMIYENNVGEDLKRQMFAISKLGIGIDKEEIERLCDGSESFSLFIEEFKEKMLRIPLDSETTLQYIALNNFGDRIDVSDDEVEDMMRKVDLSRYDLIRLLYYKYLIEGNASGLMFGQLFDMFDSYVNEYISETRYQSFNSKNIFDVLVVLALYNNAYTLDSGTP